MKTQLEFRVIMLLTISLQYANKGGSFQRREYICFK